MRIPWAGSAHIAVMIAFGLAQSVEAADNAKTESARSTKKEPGASWWNPWGAGEKKAEKKPLPKADRDDAKKAVRADKEASPEVKSLTKLEGNSERTRHQQTLFRRLDVCDQLKLIATQKRDDQLMRQAEDMDGRAWDIYMQRVANLDAVKAAAGPRDLEIDSVTPTDERSK